LDPMGVLLTMRSTNAGEAIGLQQHATRAIDEPG
jgi:hypothetical protein